MSDEGSSRFKNKNPIPVQDLTTEQEILLASVISSGNYVESVQKEIRAALSENLPLDYLLIPGLKVRQVKQIRAGLKSGIDVSQYANPQISDSEMKQIREALEMQQEVYTQQELVEPTESEQEPVVNPEPVSVQKTAPEIIVEKVPVEAFLMEQIVLAKNQKLPISLLCDPNLTPDQQHEIRLGLKTLPERTVRVYSNPKIPSEVMREIRIALADGFSPTEYDYSSPSTLFNSYKQFYMRQPLKNHPFFPYKTLYQDKLFGKKEVKFIFFAWQSGYLEEMGKHLKLPYSLEQLEEILKGYKDGIDVSQYAYLGYSAEQMQEIRSELLSEISFWKILTHRRKMISLNKKRKKKIRIIQERREKEKNEDN